MTEPLSLEILQTAVRTAAAFRCRRRLEPAGGPGDKVFPPTYAGAVYATEKRRIRRPDGTEDVVPCVLLDSVQSQANRMEEALQEAVDRGLIRIPVVEVDFSGAQLPDPVGRVTSLQAPHRLADAILRDSEHDGEPFRQSALGRRIDDANLHNATPIYELCPTALVFGLWDSTGPKGGLGAKFARAIVSEIVGISAERGDQNRGIRRDPLDIRAAARVRRTSPTSWETADDPRARGTLSPAEINLGNVPFDSDNGGVTIAHAEHTTTLSLIALRRLRFPIDGNVSGPATDDAARTVLAALALAAATMAAEKGLDLRSRCLLWPDGPAEWELLDRPGEATMKYSLDSAGVVAVLSAAVAAAEGAGIKWHADPVKLKPSDQLIALVRKSQELAAEAAGGEEGD